MTRQAGRGSRSFNQSHTMNLLLLLVLYLFSASSAFITPSPRRSTTSSTPSVATTVLRAQISEKEALTNIDKVVAALRKDKTANSELGRLEKVTVLLGYGSPNPESVAVRFNAAFRKAGKGLSSVPLPFGLGQSNVSEGRGTMVGQVKATVDPTTGKVTSCSVFRDLGYGRSFNLKV